MFLAFRVSASRALPRRRQRRRWQRRWSRHCTSLFHRNAASFDLNEATKYGNIIGTELADYGINVNLGGNINSSAASRATAHL